MTDKTTKHYGAKLMNHRFTIITVAALAVVSAIAVGIIWAMSGPEDGDRPVVRALAVIDFTDDNKMAGFAHDVFFVYVLEEPAPERSDAYDWPTTTYTVEVLETLKGSASGTVKVNQMGAVGATVEEQGAMLEPRKSYLDSHTVRPQQRLACHKLKIPTSPGQRPSRNG